MAALAAVFAYVLLAENTSSAFKCMNIQEGSPCVSCGLTRSFALILKGEINNALKLHQGSLWVFGFFASQMVLRPAAIYLFSKKKSSQNIFIAADAVFSAFLFLICFAKGYGWL